MGTLACPACAQNERETLGKSVCLAEHQLLQLQNGDNIFYPMEALKATLRGSGSFQWKKTPQVILPGRIPRDSFPPATATGVPRAQLQRARPSLRDFHPRERIPPSEGGAQGEAWHLTPLWPLGQCCNDLEVRGHFNLPRTRGAST